MDSKYFPQEIIEAVECLRRKRISLVSRGVDGRMDSAESEERVTRALLDCAQSHEWTVDSLNDNVGNNRSWIDCRIGGFPVDVKVSDVEKGSNDNTNGKAAVAFFLTGKEDSPVQSGKLFPWIKENEIECEQRDFYYLVVNKRDTSDVFPVSLKHIASLNPNPRNEPFQAKWKDCREPVDRTWREARSFLLSKWADTVKSAQKTWGAMPKHYPEFF